MRSLTLGLLMLTLLATPATAVLIDDESDNDTIPTAGTQMPSTGPDIADGGTLFLASGDIDYIGIAPLNQGNTLTVSTMPLGGSSFDAPDTIVGVFDAGGNPICINDDAFNSDDLDGLGSLCRLVIDTPGTYFVGVTGFSSVPFDGNHTETGDYVLSVTLTTVPEPGEMLLLASGVSGLVALGRLRARSDRRRARSRGKRGARTAAA